MVKLRDLSEKGIFIHRLNKLLDEHAADHHYRIADLAQDMNLSRVHLHRKIKQLTGKCCSEHIRDRKLKKARKLLKKTDKTVTEIAFEVGFNNLSYFARKFREKYHVNPSEFTNSGDQ
ncbi:MAG: helix-turn-helix transcriptional regulator [Cyclobacteriaceae bacterium]